MLTYRVKVQNESGTEIGEFRDILYLKFNKRLNNYGSCELRIVNENYISSLIALRRFTVWIYREENGDQQLVWSGEQAVLVGKLDQKGAGYVTLHCFDWLEQLNQRFTSYEQVYEDTDAGEIAWDLIDTTQDQTNGDLGITQGTIEPTFNRDRTYHNDNIMESIINLTGVISGFDFEITNFKVFNVSNIIGVDRTETVIFEYGRNINSVTIEQDFGNPVNRAIVLGQVEGENELQRIERNDTDLQALYKVREGVISEMQVSEMDTFEEKGDAFIRKYGTQLFKIDMDLTLSTVPNISDFSIGDLIRLIVSSGIYNIDEEYRVFEWQCTFDNRNAEKLSLVLGKFTL